MATATSPISFSFHETHDVRIQVIDGEPWFCLKDVCDVLALSNNRKVLSSQVDAKGVTKSYTLTEGGKQELAYINEPNLYRVIFRSNKPEAKQFQDWVFNEVLPAIRKTGRYEKQQPSAEPLAPDDRRNLTRLVWMATNGMRFDQAWNAGIWYALRAATGRPSPQPFSVDDLPVLSEECRRILKITAAFNSAVYDFEKSVIRKVGRRRQPLEPLLDLMEKRLAEIHQQESAGLLILDKLSEHGVNCLIHRQ